MAFLINLTGCWCFEKYLDFFKFTAMIGTINIYCNSWPFCFHILLTFLTCSADKISNISNIFLSCSRCRVSSILNCCLCMGAFGNEYKIGTRTSLSDVTLRKLAERKSNKMSDQIIETWTKL